MITPMAQSRAQYESMVATHAAANNVPEALVHRVIVRESKYHPNLVGRGGTIGLMQIKLATARGTLIGTHVPRTAKAFTAEVSDEAGAIARAMRHHHNTSFDRGGLARKRGELLGGASSGVDVQLARATQVWHKAGSRLVAAWVVEAYSSKAASSDGDASR